MTEITNYIFHEALIMIPVLLIIGQIVKEMKWIPEKWIPIFLMPFGILGAIGLMGFAVDSVIQGILVTGTAVYGNQLVKQIKK